MLRGLRRLFFGALVLVACIAAVGFGFRAYKQNQMDATLAIESPNGIDERQFVMANGIEHWVTIRGQDRSNPIVFFVHGGPGEVVSFVPSATQALEEDFTVVHWDQRGAGLTYGRNEKPPVDLDLIHMRDDGIAIVEWITQHLGQSKVILLGHSWGTILGLNIVTARPDLFVAYVGTGQFVRWDEQVSVQYEHVLNMAESEGDSDSMAALMDFDGPPVSDMAEYQQFRRVMSRYLAQADIDFASNQLSVLWAPRASLGGVWNALQGAMASVESLAPTLLEADIERLGTEMPFPFIVIQGQEDWITPTALITTYLDRVNAPVKRFLQIPNAGHYAFTTHPNEFLEALVSSIAPLNESGQ
jgi:pimeloyl-ACP methyl ester carboxylesterase